MQRRNGRRGSVFPVRLTDDERSELEALRVACAGPDALGPWLVWAARKAARAAGVLPARGPGAVIPELERVIPRQALEKRLILDLCAGSGAWSAPYEAAGYMVQKVTLPEDVRMFRPPPAAWGVLAAPPCTEFSLAKNGRPRDLLPALEIVGACLRIIAAVKPVWHALENPTGLLGRFLGPPRDVWEPYEFGDQWTKRTAIWGQFRIPERGPFVLPLGSAMQRATAAERAITPPGFARAFFEANQ